MPSKVILRMSMDENTKGERIECVESIIKPEDKVNHVFPLELSTQGGQV